MTTPRTLNLDAYCVRCGSDQHTELREESQRRWCNLCWKAQKAIPSGLLRYIRELEATIARGNQ